MNHEILSTISRYNYSLGKAGNCPMRNTVTNCAPRCVSDNQCPSNHKCCPNKCGYTSCAPPSAVNTGSDGGYKGSSSMYKNYNNLFSANRKSTQNVSKKAFYLKLFKRERKKQ